MWSPCKYRRSSYRNSTKTKPNSKRNPHLNMSFDLNCTIVVYTVDWKYVFSCITVWLFVMSNFGRTSIFLEVIKVAKGTVNTTKLTEAVNDVRIARWQLQSVAARLEGSSLPDGWSFILSNRLVVVVIIVSWIAMLIEDLLDPLTIIIVSSLL